MIDLIARYKNLKQKALSDGTLVFTPTMPESVTVDPLNDMIITTNELDRLDLIAEVVYGDHREWWRIAAANRLVNGSLNVPAGIQLIIPKIK